MWGNASSEYGMFNWILNQTNSMLIWAVKNSQIIIKYTKQEQLLLNSLTNYNNG